MNARQIQGAIDKCLYTLNNKDTNNHLKTYHPLVYDALVAYMKKLMDLQIIKAGEIRMEIKK